MTSPLAERSVPSPVEPTGATWEAIVERARRDLPEAAFNLWFSELRSGELKGDVFEVIVPSTYVKNWLLAHHMDLITASVRDVLGPRAKVRLKTERPKRNQQSSPGSSTEEQGSGAGRGRTSHPGRARP